MNSYKSLKGCKPCIKMSNQTFCSESDKLSFFSGSREWCGQRLAYQRSDANLARLKSDMARLERMIQTIKRDIVFCDVLIAEKSQLRECAVQKEVLQKMAKCAPENKACYLQDIAEYEGYLAECVLELVSLVG